MRRPARSSSRGPNRRRGPPLHSTTRASSRSRPRCSRRSTRRAGQAVRHALQNALDSDMFLADRDRALPQALHRRRLERVYELGKDFATRGCRRSTTPSSRWSSGTRPTPTTRDQMRRLEECVAAAAGGGRLRGELDFSPRGAGSRCANAILEETGIDILAYHDRDSLAAAIEDKAPHIHVEDLTWPQLVDDLVSRRSSPTCLQRRSSSTTPRSSRRSPRTTGRGGPRRALRGVRQRHGDLQRLHRAQRPRRAARARSRPRRATRPRATRRRSRSTSRSSRRSSTACRRPAAWARIDG